MKVVRNGLVMASLLLAACSTPQDQIHTLSPRAGAPAVERSNGNDGPGVELALQVLLPETQDRAAWVLRQGERQLVVLEHQRWPQPLSAEMRQALALRLDPLLPRVAWRLEEAPRSAQARRVVLQVLSQDSWLAPEPGVADDWRWRLECARAPAGQVPTVLRSGALRIHDQAPNTRIESAPDWIAARQAQALQQLAEQIAAAWPTADDAACGTPG